MCIIAVKPAGVVIDEEAKKWLRNGASNNTHGAGLMYSDGEVVHYNKGWGREDKTKTIKCFIKYAASIPAEYPMVIHFRNASSEPKDAGNTHPIPLFLGDEALRKTEGTCDIALVHNGVVDEWSKKRNRDYPYSDTQMLARKLNDMGIEAEDVPDELWRNYTIRDPGARDNRYVVMTPTALDVVGDFIEVDEGWLFSNNYYTESDMRPKHS